MTASTEPFVSVIVPAYNEAKNIGALLESLMAQEYPRQRLEIIVVDDGSQDETAAIVNRYPVRLISHTAPRGCCAARTAGIAVASGELIAFTDGDCIADRGWIRALVCGWEDSKIGAMVGRQTCRNPQGVIARLDHAWRHTNSRNRMAVGTGNVAYRREVIERLNGFSPAAGRGGDLDLAYRMLDLHLYTFAYRPEAVIAAGASDSLGDFWERWSRYGKTNVHLAALHPHRISADSLRDWRVLKSLVKHALLALLRLPLGVVHSADRVMYLCEEPLFILRTLAQWSGARLARREQAVKPLASCEGYYAAGASSGGCA